MFFRIGIACWKNSYIGKLVLYPRCMYMNKAGLAGGFMHIAVN